MTKAWVTQQSQKKASVLCNVSYYFTCVNYVTTIFNHNGLRAAIRIE